MKRLWLSMACLLVLGGCAKKQNLGADIYDPQSDGAVQIGAALQQAKTEGKHVLLDFGANWCVWCHRLHTLFATDAAVANKLKTDFVVVMIDVNTRNGTKRNAAVNERYGNPIQHGLPVLMVLDADGKALTTQDSGALEIENSDRHSPEKVLAFLAQWAPKR